MFGAQLNDVIAAGLILILAPVALIGYRINQRCKIRRTWWSHVDGFITGEHVSVLSTPASNLGLALFSGAITGIFVIALTTALRHHVAASFIFFTLWTPLVVGVLAVVFLPVVLIYRWVSRAIAGVKRAL